MHGKTGMVIQVIKNCKVYKNKLECLECDDGHYWVNPFECRPVIIIDNCLKYET